MTEKEERMIELLKRNLEIWDGDEYIVDTYKYQFLEDIKKLLDDIEVENIKEKFDILMCNSSSDFLKKFQETILKKDKAEFVIICGFYDFIKPIIEKYWNNMDELFDKLEKIYLRKTGEKDNEESKK